MTASLSVFRISVQLSFLSPSLRLLPLLGLLLLLNVRPLGLPLSFKLSSPPLFSLTQLAMVEIGVALAVVSSTDEEVPAEAGGLWHVPAVRAVRINASVCVETVILIRQGSVLPAMLATVGGGRLCRFLVLMSHYDYFSGSWRLIGTWSCCCMLTAEDMLDSLYVFLSSLCLPIELICLWRLSEYSSS